LVDFLLCFRQLLSPEEFWEKLLKRFDMIAKATSNLDLSHNPDTYSNETRKKYFFSNSKKFLIINF